MASDAYCSHAMQEQKLSKELSLQNESPALLEDYATFRSRTKRWKRKMNKCHQQARQDNVRRKTVTRHAVSKSD